jgi:alkylhydroperoxidase family enzyme
MSEPRIAPGRRSEVGWINWVIAAIGGRVIGTNPPRLFLTLGRHRGLFRGWLMFAGRMMPRGKLPRRETELVILRVAHLRGSKYEFEHHVRLGRKAGLREPDFDRVTRGPEAEGWSERERTLLVAADELDRERTLGDATWTSLRRYLDERQSIEFCMLVGHYEMLATFIETLRIQPDGSR